MIPQLYLLIEIDARLLCHKNVLYGQFMNDIIFKEIHKNILKIFIFMSDFQWAIFLKPITARSRLFRAVIS